MAIFVVSCSDFTNDVVLGSVTTTQLNITQTKFKKDLYVVNVYRSTLIAFSRKSVNINCLEFQLIKEGLCSY